MAEKEAGRSGVPQGSRPASASADTESTRSRLGSLSMPEAPKAEPGAGGLPTGPVAEDANAASVTRSGVRKKRFAPVNPARRKVKEDPDGGASGSTPVGLDVGDFQDLIKQAQSDAANRGGSRRGRGRGMRGRGAVRHQVVFGAQVERTVPGLSVLPSASTGGATGKERRWRWGWVWGRGGESRGNAAQGRVGPDGRVEIKNDEEDMKAADKSGFIGFLDPDKYYPTVLPLEPPGMESLVDDEEIAAPPDLATAEMVESNAAEEMGLLGNQDDDQLLLFQMPDVLPIRNPKAGQRAARRELLSEDHRPEPPCMSLGKLPAGKVGKLLVFESGKVKMQIGEVLLDVQPGVPCGFRQDVAAMNAEAGHAVFLGDVAQRVVCSPDMEQLLSANPAPTSWQRAPSVGNKVEGGSAVEPKEERKVKMEVS